jgi:hypothetical protein
MSWDYRTEIIDNRENLDPRPNQIDTILKTKLLSETHYIYTYNEATNGHSLRFNGLFRYWNKSASDVEQTLFNLPRRYPTSPIPDDVLNDAINDWIQTINLRHERSYDKNIKYNWMLAVYARSVRYSTPLARIIADSPNILNYTVTMNPFMPLIMILGVEFIEIPAPDDNYFNLANEYYTIRFWNVQTLAQVASSLRQARDDRFSTTHMTWHWQSLHTIHYNSESDMLEHLSAKVLEDWEQTKRYRKGALVITDRVIQRLVILNGTDYARRIAAVGALYPSEFESGTVLFDNKQEALLQLADAYFRTNDEVYQARYMQAYNDPNTLYCDQRHMNLITSLEPSLIYPFVTVLVVPERTSLMVSNATLNRVQWRLRPYGNETITTNPHVTLGISSEQSFRMLLSEQISTTPDDIFGYVTSRPNVAQWDAIDVQRDSDRAEQLFVTGTSRGLGMLNNSITISNMITRFRSQYRRKFELLGNMGIMQYSIDHLMLASTISNELQFQPSGRIMPIEDGTLRTQTINNSTYKLLGCYRVLVKTVRPLNYENFQMMESESLTILGAENEPAVNILRRFTGGKVMGYGDRAVEPNIRAKIPFSIDINVSSTFLISDVDQTEASQFQDMVTFTLMIVTQCITIARMSMIKINYPSTYLINRIRQHLDTQTLATDNSYAMRVVKVCGQNPFTYECFILINSIETVGQVVYYQDPVPIIGRYITSKFSANETFSNPSRVQELELDMQDVRKDYGKTLLGCAPVFEMPAVLANLKAFASECVTWRTDQADELVNVVAKVDPARMAFIARSVQHLAEMAQYYRYIPNGFGFKTSSHYSYHYSHAKWTLIHRFMIYEELRADILDQANITSVYSVGGRNITEVIAIPSTMKYVVQDPGVLGEDAILQTNFNITIVRTNFDYEAIQFEANTIYLFIFVIMNNSDGISVSETDQINRIANITKALQLVANSHAYINYYDRDLISNLALSSSMREVTTTGTKITFGNYEPVDTLEYVNVTKAIEDNGMVSTFIPLTTHALISVCTQYGIRLDDVGGSMIELASHGVPLLRIHHGP